MGSALAGSRVVAILPLVEKCWLLGLPARANLGAVLPGLGDVRMRGGAEWTPSRQASCQA